jgi:lipopolysaccharide biosynthesis protein
LPIHLGFYDLRLADNLREQAALARKYGVHGFCFHHYWFSGKKLLEAPLATLLKNTDIDLPFCINWANENWTRGWDGGHSKILQSQNYAQNDAIEFARSVTDVMRDKRYIRVNGRPLLLVYRPELIPEIASVIRVWRTYFLSVGIGDPYIAMCRVIPNSTPEEFGIDAVVGFPPHPNGWHFPNINERFVMFDRNFLGEIKDYDALVADSLSVLNKSYKYFYGICPGFDNEPRRPGRGVTFHGSSPSKYGAWMEEVYQRTLLESSGDERLIFINAWNEWGEGAHLEPDRHYGYAFLAETARVLSARQYVPRP